MDDYSALVKQAQHSKALQQRHEAFNELVRLFQGMAYRYAYATLGDVHLAEDAAQDAFISAYQNLDQLREAEAFPAWLRRIVYTQCDRLIRKKEPQTFSIEDGGDVASSFPDPEAAVVEEEVIRSIQLAVKSLPEHERDVAEGFYFQGETQKEIAERLSLPVETVKKRLQYARQRLRGLIANFNETIDLVFYVPQQPQRQYQPIYIRRDPPRKGPHQG